MLKLLGHGRHCRFIFQFVILTIQTMRAIRTPFRFKAGHYDTSRQQKMQQGAAMMLDAQRALGKRGHTVLSKVGPKDGKFSLWDHYPADKIIDSARRYQYYYHSHRSSPKEHGHFHLFSNLQADGTICTADTSGEQAVSHLLAIGMSPQGLPNGIFSTNLWVTGGYWLPAGEVMTRLNGFTLENARHWVQVTRWLTGFVQLFWPQIEALLQARDRQAEEWRGGREWPAFWEDQSIEVLNYIPVDFHKQIGLLEGRI